MATDRTAPELFEVLVPAERFGAALRAQIEAHADAMGLSAVERPLRFDPADGAWLAASHLDRRSAQALRRQLTELGLEAQVRPASPSPAERTGARAASPSQAVASQHAPRPPRRTTAEPSASAARHVEPLHHTPPAAWAGHDVAAEDDAADADDDGWGGLLGFAPRHAPAPLERTSERADDAADADDADGLPLLDWFPDESEVPVASDDAPPPPRPEPPAFEPPPTAAATPPVARADERAAAARERAAAPPPPRPSSAPRPPRRPAPVLEPASPLWKRVALWGSVATALAVIGMMVWVALDVPQSEASRGKVPRETPGSAPPRVEVSSQVAGRAQGRPATTASSEARTAQAASTAPVDDGDESDRETARALFEEGRARCDAGRFAECEATMQAVVTLDPDFREAYDWLLKARAAVERARREAAGEVFDDEPRAPQPPKLIVLTPDRERAAPEVQPPEPPPERIEVIPLHDPPPAPPQEAVAPRSETPGALPRSPEELRQRARGSDPAGATSP